MGYQESAPELAAKIRELEKRIKILENTGRLTSASIGAGGLAVKGGGSIVVQDGGAFAVFDATNTYNLLSAGRLAPAYNRPDGKAQVGVFLLRDDGKAGLRIWDPDPSAGGYRQRVALYDDSGNEIVSDDPDSQKGLASPYIPLTWHDADNARWPRYSSTTFGDAWSAVAYSQHPKISIGFWAASTVAGTAGEYQILANGTVVAGPTALAGLSNSAVTSYGLVVAVPSSVSFQGSLIIKIQFRVTGGTGAIFTQPYLMAGVRS